MQFWLLILAMVVTVGLFLFDVFILAFILYTWVDKETWGKLELRTWAWCWQFAGTIATNLIFIAIAVVSNIMLGDWVWSMFLESMKE
jgi:hypothetical protein